MKYAIRTKHRTPVRAACLAVPLLLWPSAAQAVTYYVDVQTEGYDNSGTDDGVWIYIEGERGTLSHSLDQPDPDIDDQRVGEWDYYKFESDKDIGRVTGARVVLHDGPSQRTNEDDWEFYQIRIYGPADRRFPNWTKATPGHPDAKGKTFDLFALEGNGGVSPARDTQGLSVGQQVRDDWFDVMQDPPRNWEPVVTNRLNTTGYFINVLTADREDAGTDDEVYITLFGERGQSKRFKLDNRIDMPDDNDHRRGEWDYYKFKSDTDLGRITDIKLELDGDDGWTPAMVYVLGPSDPLFPDWRREGAGPRDKGSRRHDFYRFPTNNTELDEGKRTSLTVSLDDRGQQDLAKVVPNHELNWSANSPKWVLIESFKPIAVSAGIGDAARVMGQIGGYLAQAGIESTPYVGDTIGPVIVEVVPSITGDDDWGGVGQSLVEKIDSITAGEDEFYFKVDGKDINTGVTGELYTRLDNNEVRTMNHKFHLNKLVSLELMEWDNISNDSLGGMIFNPNMPANPDGQVAIIAHHDARSVYEVKYYIVECSGTNPNITVKDGKATC